MQDNIFREKKDIKRLLIGIDKATTVIGMSYGPSGSNVLLGEDLYPFHSVTNDGKSIVDKIKLEDPIEQMGVDIMKELGDKAEKDSGDGRKTTMILANAIIRESQGLVDNPMDVKRSLDECLPVIIKSIDDQKKEITPDEVGAVATIAAENETIGKLLQEVYQKIGKEGIIELDVSNTFETIYEIKEGVRIRNAGFISPYMATEENKAIYKKPKILITKTKISTLQDINPLFQKLSESGTSEVVIYCDEIAPEVLNALAFTHSKGIFKTLIIKAPTLWKDWFYEDFALITGATIVEASSGVSYQNVGLEHLGTCEKIITTKEETTVIGIKDVSAHIKKLEEEGTNESKLRASWLNTKAAVLKLGSNSESELSYISKKARDGRNAASLALKDGVVQGGGISLVKAAVFLPETIGGSILKEALRYPTRIIIHNTTGEAPYVNDSVDIEEHIMDPAIVVKNAITNAISVAGTILTAKAIVILPKVEHDDKIKPHGPSIF